MKEKENKEVKEVDEKPKKRRTTRVKKEVEIEKEEPTVKEIIVEKKSGFNYAEVIVIMIIMLIVGGMTGSFITYLTKGKSNTKVINNIVKSEIPEEMQEFLNTYNNIINDYYKDVDHKELLEAGINGMLNYLDDDYSVYMNKEESDAFNQQVEGKYTGIGVEILIGLDGTVTINRVFDGSPAAESGLKKDDIIINVNGDDITKENAANVASMIKESGKPNAEVVVMRGEEKLTFNLKLQVVDIESVISKIFEKNGKKIGYIDISIFASNTYTQFNKELEKLEKENIDSLIIDVRGNSGGYLTTVTDIASLFLNKSKVIYQLDTKGIIEKIYSKTNKERKYDIVVLTNKGSASASEILAAALQESYGAKVIGTGSYGKGTVQAAYTLSSGAIVKYTIQKWLTPKGNWINETGITPDIEEVLGTEYLENPSDETDNQLQRAITELSK